MGKLVRLWRGEWLKEGDGAWNFNADPTDFGMRYVVGQGSPVLLSYQFPAWILGPLGRRSLPISVTKTADIPIKLSVREWFTELVLVVTIGAESVARFNFNRRDNFVIGRKRFVVDGSQDEYARREYQRLVVGRRMRCNRSILEEIFNEQEMMVLHRVDLEMDLADTLQEQADWRYESVAREVILVEDDDENMTDAQTSGGNDHAPNQDPSQLPLIQPPTAPSEMEALTEGEVHLHFLAASFEKFLGNETIRSQVPQPPQPVVAPGSGMSVSEKCQDQTTVVVTAKLGLTIDCGGMGAPGLQDVTPKNPNSSSDESGADGGFN
ncbi:unnamed protein product [Brassica oleracea]